MLSNAGANGESGQNSFHFSNFVLQISTYGVGEWGL